MGTGTKTSADSDLQIITVTMVGFAGLQYCRCRTNEMLGEDLRVTLEVISVGGPIFAAAVVKTAANLNAGTTTREQQLEPSHSL